MKKSPGRGMVLSCPTGGLAFFPAIGIGQVFDLIAGETRVFPFFQLLMVVLEHGKCHFSQKEDGNQVENRH
jgi:hypothetical protein